MSCAPSGSNRRRSQHGEHWCELIFIAVYSNMKVAINSAE
jgi:hypothetical protein